jgi:hypothetical protein
MFRGRSHMTERNANVVGWRKINMVKEEIANVGY